MSFTFQAIRYLAPFLGPYYAWIAAVSPNAYLPVPKALLLIGSFLAKQLSKSYLEEVSNPGNAAGAGAQYQVRGDAAADESIDCRMRS